MDLSSKYVSKIILSVTRKDGRSLSNDVGLPLAANGVHLTRIHLEIADSCQNVCSMLNNKLADSNMVNFLSNQLATWVYLRDNNFQLGKKQCLFIVIVFSYFIS